MQFKNPEHEKIFRQVIHGLRGLGYRGSLIQEEYSFPDLFSPDAPVRVLPAGAFGREPPSYDTACIAIVIPNHRSGVELVSEYRALGAPVALEIADDRITQWKVTAETNRIAKLDAFHPSSLPQKLRERKDEWSPDTIVRGKNVYAKLGLRQLDFIDLGLIPALEKQVRDKLDYLLREVVSIAVSVHKDSTGREPDMQRLFRLIFRFIAAKLLSDRRVPGFRSVDRDSDPEAVLTRVSRYYKQTEPIIEDTQTRAAVADAIWGGINFQNLSAEALADIYEGTLVDEQLRHRLGTHSTPASVASYVVSRLINEENASGTLQIVEPCSGHAIFLVAALERLRDLLPSSLDPQERHQLFVRMLRGFERDSFALEIGKLCLMLADFPFPDGWHLVQADVFASTEFTSSLARADIVLSNPPFGNFSTDERERYPRLRSIQKPAELLHRVLDRLKPSGILGFVLPHQFVDGRAYRDVRRRLADRYQSVEVVSLPDRIFHVSKLETALLMAKEPCAPHTSVRVSFSQVADVDRAQFLLDYRISRRDVQNKTKSGFAENARVSLLGELWERLSDLPRLADYAELHRGIEWQPPYDEKKYVSLRPKSGFAKGLRCIPDEYLSFQVPSTVYLSMRPEDQRTNAYKWPWNKPKVIANAARLQRGPWRLAAFADQEGLVCYQRFFGIWPSRDWTAETLSAILNGPLANAFIHAHEESSRDNQKSTMKRIPLPLLTEPQRIMIDRLVDKYRNIAATDTSLFSSHQDVGTRESILRATCLEIDAIVLRGYSLPPRMERNLLDLFQGYQRRVAFSFTEYFPADFTPTIPLWMYISDDFQRCRADYLISRIPQITDPTLLDALAEVE